jgi:peptidoglycan-associated lipoprotein
MPALSEFYAPSALLQVYFHAVHFDTDEYVSKDKHELETLTQLAAYLKQNQNIYLFIQGHCDERASASYNMALGLRRANFVRSFLVKQGVDLNRIFTTSCGKEQPLALGHSPNDWKANRRSEFKIYEK